MSIAARMEPEAGLVRVVSGAVTFETGYDQPIAEVAVQNRAERCPLS